MQRRNPERGCIAAAISAVACLTATSSFLGRIDEQVKIRGFRIELGEVEAALDRHCGVSQAAVLAREDACGDERLLAYVVAASSARPAARELREFLLQCLPERDGAHAASLTLDALPMTPNGKVSDKSALPAPQALAASPTRAMVSPQGSIEHGVAAIQAEVLGVGQAGVGRSGQFFRGSAATASRPRGFSQHHARFGVELPYETFLGLSTVAETSACSRPPRNRTLRVRSPAQEDSRHFPGSGEEGWSHRRSHLDLVDWERSVTARVQTNSLAAPAGKRVCPST